MSGWIDARGASFESHFARRESTSFTHSLHDHPLLKVEAVADLADRLAKDSVICDEAVKPLLVPGGGPPRGVQPRPGDLIRDLEHSGTWLTLLNIEQDQAYRQLVDECLDELAPFVERFAGDMRRRVGFLFVSSPNSVTPAHFDLEHSLPMQVQGSRTLTIGRFTTMRDADNEVRRYWNGSHGRMESLPEESVSYPMEAGVGAYIPPLVPHWITNGPTSSVSMTLTFFTKDTDERSLIQAFNHRVERLRMKPTPPGHSLVRDAAKVAFMRAYALRRTFTGGGEGATDSHT